MLMKKRYKMTEKEGCPPGQVMYKGRCVPKVLECPKCGNRQVFTEVSCGRGCKETNFYQDHHGYFSKGKSSEHPDYDIRKTLECGECGTDITNYYDVFAYRRCYD